MPEIAIYAIFKTLKLCLRSMCGAKSVLLPSMCKAKYALLPSMCGAKSTNLLLTWMGAIQTSLRTWKRAMQTLLRTWSRDIVAGTKKKQNMQFLPIFKNIFLTTYFLGVYMTYVTTFEIKNILSGCSFKQY